MKSCLFTLITISLFFHFALNQYIPIQNLDDIFIKPGITNYTYQYPGTNEEAENPYLFFKFSEIALLNFKIVDGKGVVTTYNVNEPKEFISYKIRNLTAQNFTLIINNKRNQDENLIFVDNSNEINTTFDKYCILVFLAPTLEDKPRPLLFNFEPLKFDTILFIKQNYSLLEYCVIKENECNYTNSIELNFKKGDKIKFKYNSDKNSYAFSPIIMSLHITIPEAISFNYGISRTIRYLYLYIDVRNLDNFYIYSKKYFEAIFYSEDNKDTFIHDGTKNDKFQDKDKYSAGLYYFNRQKQYFIIYRPYDLAHKSITEYGTFYLITNSHNLLNYDEKFTLDNESFAILAKKKDLENKNEYILCSSNKNLALVDSKFDINNLTNLSNFIIFDNYNKESFIFKALSNQKTIFDYFAYRKNKYSESKIDFTINNILLNYYLEQYGGESFFIRNTYFNFEENITLNYFFTGIEEKYYLYFKKFLGNISLYRYNSPLNESSNITKMINISEKDYDLINNKLLILSGYQLFTFINYKNNLFDLYIQKVQDNSKIFQSNNFVKIINANKIYYLDFEFNYLVKLEYSSSETVVTFTLEDEKFILNKENRVIYIRGTHIEILSTQNALLYFYQEMDNSTKSGMVEFNKNQTRKIMKLSITYKKYNYEKINISIAKDFGFQGYYPMLNKDKWENIKIGKNITLYYESSILEGLEYELYENENLYICFFDYSEKNNLPTFSSDNFIISKPIYFDNLKTPKNKFNFEVIPPNSKGYLILDAIHPVLQYSFYMCKSKEIKMKIENVYFETVLETTIKNDGKMKNSYIDENKLFHSFESDKEFLFIYPFEEPKFCNFFEKDYSLLSAFEISKNIIQVKFIPTLPLKCHQKFTIIITKKNEVNNMESFSDPCFVSKLLIQNSNDDIFIESFNNSNYNFEDLDIIIYNFNISKLNFKDNSELIITLVSYDSYNYYSFYKPIILDDIKFTSLELEEEYSFSLLYKKYFKYEYNFEENNPKELCFNFGDNDDFYLFINQGDKTVIFEYDFQKPNLFRLNLTKSGTIYFEFYSPKYERLIYVTYMFYAFIYEEKFVDLNKKFYYKKLDFYSQKKMENKYKVKELNEDKIAYFNYYTSTKGYDYSNPFIICNDITSDCTKNISNYKFLQNTEYTIYINYSYIKKNYREDDCYYYYPSFILFPISEDSFEEKKEGYHFFSEPKIFIIELINKAKLQIYFENVHENIYKAFSNEKININNFNKILLQKYNNNDTFSEDDGNYLILLVFPSNIKYNSKIIIVNQILKSDNSEFTIKDGKNALIIYDQYFGNLKPFNFFYNDVITISSKIKNMLNIISNEQTANYNFFCFKFMITPIYVEKYKEENTITISKYQSRYASFIPISYNLIHSYFKYLSETSSLSFDENKLLPFYKRINTDISPTYDFANLYLYESEKLIIYFKKIFGSTDIYECNFNSESINNNDYSNFTKPISFVDEKKSILNKLYTFKETKLLIGYLAPNSYFDIYIDLIDNYKITISSFPFNLFNNAAKYLQKDKEYNIDFNANHLIKLEPGFNTNVYIYNKYNTIILNSTFPTAHLKGNNFNIKADDNAMVYLYEKLIPIFTQVKIKPEKNKNIEIKLNNYDIYVIDFGFEGYNPMNDIYLDRNAYTFANGGTVLIENYYDKLKTELVENENLYLYHSAGLDVIINYSENLNNPNNEYTFYMIPKDSEEKTLIINNINKNRIKFLINYCQSPHNVNMFYQTSITNETLFIFNNSQKELILSKNQYSAKLRFESEEDFIFSYSFYDERDISIQNGEWKKDREELELKIEEISIKKINDEYSNTISIKFNPNYKASTTRYIITIIPKTKSNTFDIVSNRCYITKLVTQKSKEIKIINIADTGENGLITVDADISDFLKISNKFVITIISQELRFDKKLNYYPPKEFYYNTEEPKRINIKSDIKFDILKKPYFDLPYTKLSEMNEMFLLNYKLEELIHAIIHIYHPDGKEEIFKTNKIEGYINFLCDKSGSYKIEFENEEINNFGNNNNAKGIFKIFSTEYPIKLDITKEEIEFNEFNISREDTPSLKFDIENLDKDYTKKLSISNVDYNNINRIVLISKNDEEYQALNFNYYTFEKDINYSIIIYFNQKDTNIYTLENINISDFSSENIHHFSPDEITYYNIDDKFIIINWKNYKNISITIKNKNPKFLISDLFDNQVENLVKEFQNMKFKELENLNISKPFNYNYSVLLIQLFENETQLNFKIIDNKDNKRDDNTKKGLPTFLIVLLIIFGLLIIFVIIIFIRCYKKRNKVDIERETLKYKEEILLKDL